jgi:multidrug resistance efflux pump
MEDRNRKLKSIESRPCPRCQCIAVGEQSRVEGLPLLSGSYKQIAWGGQIRKSLLATWGEQLSRAEALLADAPADRKAEAATLLSEAQVEYQQRREYTDARWWIENQHIVAPLDFVVARRDAEKRKLRL